MKYLKLFKASSDYDPYPFWDEYSISEELNSKTQAIIGQPKSGPTTVVFKSLDDDRVKVVYCGKEIIMDNECPVKYTWKFEYYQGYPVITINFSKNDYYNSGVTLFICLECKNMKNEFVLVNALNIENAPILTNKSLGVYKDFNNVTDLTYIYLNNIEINKDYHLFITVTDKYKQNYCGGQDTEYKGLKPLDWKCKLWLRPSIRCSKNGLFGEHINSGLDTHYSKVPAEDYRYFEFNYYDVLNVVNENI